MAEHFHKGDAVSWNTPQGRTTGKIVHIITEEAEHLGRHVRASKDDPSYLVESDKTGKQAVHKPDALKKM